MRWPGRVLWGLGEAAVTFGVLVLLLVVHQLWWSNVTGHAAARHAVAALERHWDAVAPKTSEQSATARSGAVRGRAPATAADASSSGPDGYAVIRIPRIGVTAPIAEGVSKARVLNHGFVGHYPGTAQPGELGNFALAGHRNTHGEPFRYINRLRIGDTVSVETATARYTYVVIATVPRTSADDGTVIAPVPYSSVHPADRLTGPGHYLTLTTCTPEYTSLYRLVVWGRLRSVAPR